MFGNRLTPEREIRRLFPEILANGVTCLGDDREAGEDDKEQNQRILNQRLTVRAVLVGVAQPLPSLLGQDIHGCRPKEPFASPTNQCEVFQITRTREMNDRDNGSLRISWLGVPCARF
jgi:hypothetical protein